MIDLWELLAAENPAAAVAAATAWRASSHLLLRRMWLHTLSTTVHDGGAVAAAVDAIADEDFWTNGARREVMRLLVERWDEIGPDAQAAAGARCSVPASGGSDRR